MEAQQLARLILSRLDEAGPDISRQWAAPEDSHTRHFHIDDLLPAEVAKAVYEAFPRNADGFFDRNTFRERKKTLTSLGELPPILSSITYALQDAAVVARISSLLGLKEVLPDPTLYAGGLSMMFEGDFLNPHIDNSHDGQRNLYRRLNLLYYVSPDWELENGGNFELWDEEVRQQKTIVSRFNRLVVMETNKRSWHSVSPVRAARPRCCVSNYYFSKQSPDAHDYFHVTSFSGRPDETGKRLLGYVDNRLRGLVSRALGTGRGRNRLNGPKD